MTTVPAPAYTPPEVGEPLLEIAGLTVVRRDDPSVRIVDDVSLTVRRGQALGVAGESGCGKTTTALALMGLLPRGLRRAAGTIDYHGARRLAPLHRLPGAAMRQLRWASISMIFQGAMNALDPVKTVGHQIAEAIELHEPHLSKRAVSRRVSELLDQVGVASKRAVYYPHEFSGGQKQRIMIALALACRPKIVIGDEPTTALDVITQAQILQLLGELRRELGLTLILITHDLAVLAQACDQVAVMYAGQVVETGAVADVYRAPQHPYTARLIDLLGADDAPGTLPTPIPGSQPRPDSRPTGCRFHDRCAFATDLCRSAPPPLVSVGENHGARCHFAPWADGVLRGGGVGGVGGGPGLGVGSAGSGGPGMGSSGSGLGGSGGGASAPGEAAARAGAGTSYAVGDASGSSADEGEQP